MEASFMGYPFKTMWRGLVTHLLIVASLIGGLFFGVSGIMNLLIFFSWVYCILMVVLLFTSSDGLKPNIPPPVSLFFYGALVIILVYAGCFGIGAAWLVSGLILGHLTDEYTKKMAELAEKNTKKGPQIIADTGSDESEASDVAMEEITGTEAGSVDQAAPSTLPLTAP